MPFYLAGTNLQIMQNKSLTKAEEHSEYLITNKSDLCSMNKVLIMHNGLTSLNELIKNEKFQSPTKIN